MISQYLSSFIKKIKLYEPTSLFYFVLLFLFLPFFFRIAFFIFAKWNYIYDEIIVLDVSTQKLPQMMKTILAEPHPPGFYLLLSMVTKKIDPFLYPVFYKILFLTINTLFWLYIIFYAKAKKVIKEQGEIFFMLLFSMYSVLRINTELKQDIVSLPILVFLILNFILLIDKKINYKKGILVHFLLSTFLLFLGYVYFAASCVVTALLVLIFYKKKLIWLGILLQSTIFIVYFKLFLFQQLLVNRTRFAWFSEYNSDIFSSITKYVSKSGLNNYIADAQVYIFGLLVLLGIFYLYKKTRKIFFVLLALLSISFFLSLTTKIFINARYVLPFHMLLTAIAAITLKILYEKNRIGSVALIAYFFLVPSFTINLEYLGSQYYVAESMKSGVINSQENIGFLTQDTIASYVLQRKIFLNSKNVIPLSKEFKSYSYGGHIDFNILEKDTKVSNLSFNETRDWLKETGLKSFLYVKIAKELGTIYDPNLITKKVLENNCEIKENILVLTKTEIYKYSGCF